MWRQKKTVLAISMTIDVTTKYVCFNSAFVTLQYFPLSCLITNSLFIVITKGTDNLLSSKRMMSFYLIIIQSIYTILQLLRRWCLLYIVTMSLLKVLRIYCGYAEAILLLLGDGKGKGVNSKIKNKFCK